MMWEQTVASNPIAVWSIVSSLAGGLLVFALVRLAIFLSRQGDVEVFAKRLTDLNPCLIKLFLRIENGQAKARRLSDISLYAKVNGALTKVADLEETPLLRKGEPNFVIGQGKDACLQCAPHSLNEAVLEFRTQEAHKDIYLVYTNMQGKKRKAKVLLSHANEQILSFRSF